MTSPEVWTEATSKVWRDSGRTSFSPPQPMKLCSHGVENLYNAGQKALGKWWNIRDSCNFCLNRLHRCLWGEGRGWPHVTSKALQQQILAETCPINRLFTASGSRGTKLPYWRTRDVLGQPKRRKNAILNDVSSLFVFSQYVLWSPG